MAETWLIRVYNDHVLATFKECVGPVELGRQNQPAGEELNQVTALADGGHRIVIAPSDDLRISRRHARVEEIAPGRVLVRNFSDNNSIVFEDGSQLRPRRQREADLPVLLRIGAKVVRIQPTNSVADGFEIQSLDEPTAAPGSDAGWVGTSTISLGSAGPLEAKGVFGWLKAMIRVLQSAATDADFFQKAAQAVVEVVGLDMGRVLIRDGDSWQTAAFHPVRDGEYERNNPPSRMVLDRVCQTKKASWLDPSKLDKQGSSLAGVASVVATPVLARSGEVIAILYGERRLQSLMASGRPVSQLEALLIEVLAVGLAAGLARVEQERHALARKTQFEQFFTPELARVLAEQPMLLVGKDLEISVLFCDIRGFSRITRNHGPAITVEWTQDVLSTLSECVLAHQGVLVDYIGDELMAMWGAPEEQPDHAERACRAALDMLGALKGLDERWQEKLGEPTGLGIGINTGLARVGNTGSRRKFKYGPLGDPVNVASRVQGASKYFKSSLLITRATRDRLGPGFQLRRLGTARMVNISDPIELYELCSPDLPDSCELCSTYEEGLAAFEAREFRRATGVLGRLVYVYRDDGPSFALLARALAYIVDEPETFDPAFRLPGK
jgi:adenylate cyclase